MATETHQAIETIFLEERRYAPPPEFAAQANAKPDIYDREPDEFWKSEARERVTWFEPFTELCQWEPPYAEWFVGGTLNITYNCVDRHVEAGRGGAVAYYWEGEPVGDRRELTFADLQRETTKLANALKALGVGKGTPVGIYMGMVPETPIAMLACARHRRPAHRGLRGFLGRLAVRPPPRHGLRGADHAGRGLAARHDRPAQEDRRRGARRLTVGAERHRPAADGRRRADAGRPRPLVARRRHRRERVPVRTDGRRGPALPAVHERDDRQAEGHRPHDRRLPRRRSDDALLHLRRQARLGVLVRRRRRLGHGPQLHRLRPALQRDGGRHVRGHARLPGQGPLVGRSSSATRSTSSTRRRRRSART